MDGKDYILHLGDNISVDNLEPVHLVTFACLIQHLKDKGANVYQNFQDNKRTADYIYNELGFRHYWNSHINHIETKSIDCIFNLWRIVDSEKDIYARNVEEYLKRTFFCGKDLSTINVCLVEAYYNVFDHAKANGNAFSLIKYDKVTETLHVAISDFGVGIAHSIQTHFPEKQIKDDVEAIKFSIQDNVTAQSTGHNKGLGLGNIISGVDNIRIFSNSGLFVQTIKSGKRFIKTTFRFPGTLIYFNVNLSNLENEEVLDTFNW